MGFWDTRFGQLARNPLSYVPGLGLVNAAADLATGGESSKFINGRMDQFGKWLPGAATGVAKTLGLAPDNVSLQQVDPNQATMPEYAGLYDQMQAGAAAAGGRQFDPAIRGGQDQLASQLWGQVRGTEPSLAQAQLQKGTDANIAQAMAMARSQRGLGAAAQMRQIDMQRAQAGQQMAQDAGILRLQEQAAAQQQLGGLYNQMGGQQLAQQQLNDRQVQFYLSQGIDLATARNKAAMDLAKYNNDIANTQTLTNAGIKQKVGENIRGTLGGIAEMAVKGGTMTGGGGSGGGGGGGGGGRSM